MLLSVGPVGSLVVVVAVVVGIHFDWLVLDDLIKKLMSVHAAVGDNRRINEKKQPS
jgi:hypothetical protein